MHSPPYVQPPIASFILFVPFCFFLILVHYICYICCMYSPPVSDINLNSRLPLRAPFEPPQLLPNPHDPCMAVGDTAGNTPPSLHPLSWPDSNKKPLKPLWQCGNLLKSKLLEHWKGRLHVHVSKSPNGRLVVIARLMILFDTQWKWANSAEGSERPYKTRGLNVCKLLANVVDPAQTDWSGLERMSPRIEGASVHC